MHWLTRKSHLRAELLQPGDVLLSDWKGIGHRVVRYLTEGPYSHAELVINTIWRLEATRIGVGFKAAKIVKCERQTDGTIRYLEDIRRARTYGVFRHPLLENMSPNRKAELTDRLFTIARDMNGLQYSELERLLTASTRLSKYPALRARLAAVLRRVEKRKIDPGPFCSELVAGIYEELEIPLFKRRHAASAVNPSMLADQTTSLLRRVNDVTAKPNARNRNVPD